MMQPPPRRTVSALRIALAMLAVAATGCGSGGDRPARTPNVTADGKTRAPAPERRREQRQPRRDAVAPLLDVHDVYAADRPGLLSPAARTALSRVYVPNSKSNTVDVIDPGTLKVVEHFPVGALPQHVTPSYDLKTLWVDNDQGNSLTPIDPRTGKPGRPVPVEDPYNLYFTPDGRYAIVVAERLDRLDFRDARTMRPHRSLKVSCPGVDHMDFTADGRDALASCGSPGAWSLSTSAASASSSTSRCGPAPCPRTSSSRPTAASSTSPTWPPTGSG